GGDDAVRGRGRARVGGRGRLLRGELLRARFDVALVDGGHAPAVARARACPLLRGHVLRAGPGSGAALHVRHAKTRGIGAEGGDLVLDDLRIVAHGAVFGAILLSHGLAVELDPGAAVPVAVRRQQGVVALAGVLHRVVRLVGHLLGEVAPGLGQRGAQRRAAIRRGAVQAAVDPLALLVVELLDVAEVVAAVRDAGVIDGREAHPIVVVQLGQGAAHGRAHQQVALAVVRVPVGVVLRFAGRRLDNHLREDRRAAGFLGRALLVEGVVDLAAAGVAPVHARLAAGVVVVVAAIQVIGRAGGGVAIALGGREVGIGVLAAVVLERRLVGRLGVVGHAVA